MDSSLETAIGDFQVRLLAPLYHDLESLLNVVAGKSNPDNNGCNFLASIGLLIGIETISNFLAGLELEEKRKVQRKAFEESITTDQKRDLKRLYGPRVGDAQKLVRSFLTDYFGQVSERYKDRVLQDNLWAFRNPQAHGFYPPPKSGVRWPYIKNPSGPADSTVGVSVADIAGNATLYDYFSSRHMTDLDGYWCINPHVLFIDLKKAVGYFLIDLQSNPTGTGATRFIGNVQKLIPV